MNKYLVINQLKHMNLINNIPVYGHNLLIIYNNIRREISQTKYNTCTETF